MQINDMHLSVEGEICDLSAIVAKSQYDGILGICIPTYNRCEVLRRNLEHLIRLSDKYGIHIFISDNASTDNTESVVAEYSDNPNVHYRRHEKNLGYDRNATAALKMCSQRYAWLLGDDDTICENIDEVLENLIEHIPDVLFLDYMGESTKSVYTEPREVFHDLMHGFSWMSALIISSKMIKEMDFVRYYDSYFVHAGAVLDLFLTRGYANVRVIKNEYVTSIKHDSRKSFETSERTIYEIWCMHWLETLSHLPTINYDDIEKEILKNRPYYLTNIKLFNQRAQNNFSLRILKKHGHYIRFYRNGPTPILYAIAIFPVPIARLIRRVYYAISKREE